MKVIWSRDAADDLADILDYLAERSPAGAASVAQAIATTEKSISDFPRAGRRDPETGCRERLVGRFPLLIVYSVGNEFVEIIAVFHTARDPSTKPRPT